MSYNYLPLDRKWLNFQQVKNLLDYDQQVSITFDAHERILKCTQYVDHFAHEKEVADQIEQSQEDLLKTHAVGIGDEVPIHIVKLMLMLKIKSLSYGHSGVQIETVKRLMEMYNNEVIPVVYSQAPSSAGGDTIALSHLSLPLIGLGQVYYQGQERYSSEMLTQLSWKPLSLQSSEGLALITGTQFTTAYGMYALKKSEQLIKFADAIGALSFSTLGFSTESLHPKLHSIHNHKGQSQTAATILKYLEGSEIGIAGDHPSAVPYSFRCTPQVHGTAKDSFEHVLNVFLKEINSVSEDPAFFPDENLVLSGGNSNGQPLALALDLLAMAVSELASIAERRIAHLSGGKSGLQLAVNENRGSASGPKAIQYTAAAIINENKLLCMPVSSSIISLNQQEDYVSSADTSATKCLRLINNVEKVLALELITAAEHFESATAAQTSPFLQKLVKDFRQQVPMNDDCLLHDELVKAVEFISSYKL